jgi:hypothetical protein
MKSRSLLAGLALTVAVTAGGVTAAAAQTEPSPTPEAKEARKAFVCANQDRVTPYLGVDGAAGFMAEYRSGTAQGVGTPEQIVERLNGMTERGLGYAIHYFPEAAYDRSGLELFADRGTRDGRPTAYLCRDFVCRLPTTDAAALT